MFELPNLSIPVRNLQKEKLPMDVVGDVSGRIAIIIVSYVFNFCWRLLDSKQLQSIWPNPVPKGPDNFTKPDKPTIRFYLIN